MADRARNTIALSSPHATWCRRLGRPALLSRFGSRFDSIAARPRAQAKCAARHLTELRRTMLCKDVERDTSTHVPLSTPCRTSSSVASSSDLTARSATRTAPRSVSDDTSSAEGAITASRCATRGEANAAASESVRRCVASRAPAPFGAPSSHSTARITPPTHSAHLSSRAVAREAPRVAALAGGNAQPLQTRRKLAAPFATCAPCAPQRRPPARPRRPAHPVQRPGGYRSRRGATARCKSRGGSALATANAQATHAPPLQRARRARDHIEGCGSVRCDAL